MSKLGFFIGEFNMLLVSALAIGLVIIVGFLMVSKIKKREPIPISYKIIHATATFIGALIVVIAAFMGDFRLWTNIILALIIVALGLWMAFGKLKKPVAKSVLVCHATIGIICYIIFIYYIITL